MELREPKMPSTYEPIQTNTLGSTTTSVTFSSIPSTYTDLIIVFSGTSNALDSLNIRFNGDTSALYSRIIISGNGSTTVSDREVSQGSSGIGLTSTTQSDTTFQVFNYSNTTTYKTILSRANVSASLVRGCAGVYRSTSAITSVTLFSSSTLNIGSTFTLYGIKAA
jgi:hypothetical protein